MKGSCLSLPKPKKEDEDTASVPQFDTVKSLIESQNVFGWKGLPLDQDVPGLEHKFLIQVADRNSMGKTWLTVK